MKAVTKRLFHIPPNCTVEWACSASSWACRHNLHYWWIIYQRERYFYAPISFLLKIMQGVILYWWLEICSTWILNKSSSRVSLTSGRLLLKNSVIWFLWLTTKTGTSINVATVFEAVGNGHVRRGSTGGRGHMYSYVQGGGQRVVQVGSKMQVIYEWGRICCAGNKWHKYGCVRGGREEGEAFWVREDNTHKHFHPHLRNSGLIHKGPKIQSLPPKLYRLNQSHTSDESPR